MSNSELAKFTASIDAAWKDLHAFLVAVTPDQAVKRDQAGWSVKDHVTHLAVWEDSVAILFRGGRRHEALGIEEAFYAASSIDEINEVIRARLEGTTLQEAVRNLQGAHRQLMGHLRTLRDADLHAKAREFFPQAPGNEDRALASLIWDNTGRHFSEHLEWMRDLVGRAA
jgi:DNA-binding transcriptional ArsR family regulator